MTITELDNWFVSITVKQKEHIAAKVLLKEGRDVHAAKYPNCWNIWKDLPENVKQAIHEHCTDNHGMWAVEENHETSLGHDF